MDNMVVWSDAIFFGILNTIVSKIGRGCEEMAGNLVQVRVAALLISRPRDADVGVMKLYRSLNRYPQVG